MFHFEKKYALFFILLLAAEIILALFINNEAFVENFGSMLMIPLLYCLILTFFRFKRKKVLLGVSIFAILLIVAQGLGWIHDSGLGENQILSVIFGNEFNFNNIWSYLAGAVLVYLLEFQGQDKRPKKRGFLDF